MIWSHAEMQSRIDNALGSELIESFNITLSMGCLTDYCINELLSRILMQDIHPNGFREITLNQFAMTAVPDTLNEDLLD